MSSPTTEILGEGMTRPLVVYALFAGVTSLALGGLVLTTGPRGSPVTAVGLTLLPLVLGATLPAVLADVALVGRLRATTWVGKALAGAVAWGGWCLFVAAVAVALSRVVLLPDVLAPAVGLSAAVGAAYSVAAFGAERPRAGYALVALGVCVVAFVLVVGLAMAGRWGSPA